MLSMGKEQVAYLGQAERPSFRRQAWHMHRFIKRAERLSPQTFELGLGSDIQKVFTGDEQSKLEQLRTHQTIPVLICALDEMKQNNIGKTLFALAIQQGVRLQPIVVDNASTDGTGQFAEKMGALVVSEEKEGVLNALRRGFEYLRDEVGYTGPILHTDADAVPLPFWAKTLVDYADANISNSGEAFGTVIYYEANKRFSFPKNSIHTVGAKVRDLRVRKRGETPVSRGPNGIIMTDSGTKILDTLSNIEGKHDEADIVMQSAVKEAEGALAACSDSNATVIVSGRRVKNMFEMGLRIVAPKIAHRRAYKSWNQK